MKKTHYIPLRVHSVYSQGKGVVDAAGLAAEAKKREIPWLPVCDPMSMVAWDPFAAEAYRQGMKPLPGIEIRLPEKGDLLLFPRSRAGYFALVSAFNRRRLGSMAEVAAVFLPLIRDFSALQRLRQRLEGAHFYLGLQWASPAWVEEAARRTAMPLVWAQPLRWLGDPLKYRVAKAVFEHLPLQESLRRDEAPGGWIPPAAISRRWGEAGQEAMANTWRLADAADFPLQKLEEVRAGEDPSLESAVQRRLLERGDRSAERERARTELKVVERMGFSHCFRIASEIGDFCRQQRIFFNLRGSGVSSFLLFLLGVSRINPLDVTGLIFERFVNGLRDDLPDIDIDIESSRRHEVLSWVFSRYGERVAFVSTHKFFGARSALYETARCAGFGPAESHALTKPLPMFAQPASLNGMEKEGMADLFSAAARLDGVFKELSLHVGGVIFCQRAAADVFPLTTSPQGFPQMAWDKDTAERLKIFKLDLLGVRGFDVISPKALDATPESFADDADVWEMIGAARTVGCFQIESPLARENLRQARPANLPELAIAVAIIRPGPAKSGMKTLFLQKRPPAHPLLARIFPQTRGALIFEEQVSILLSHVVGWKMEMAEKVRRELKVKRKNPALEERYAEFCRLGERRGWKPEDLALFWKLAADFSLYAFCQAHSTAYAYSAYLSARMKQRFPRTFFCRLFNAGGGYYPLPVYIDEARRWHVRILPPDVNCSLAGFAEEEGWLRTGLLFVKGVGDKLAGRILENRGSGYPTVEDFVRKTRAGERELSALLSVGAFASIGVDGFSSAEKEAHWKRFLGFLPDDGSMVPHPV